MVEGMSVVVNVILSQMSVMSPPPASCNLSLRTVMKFDSVYVDLQYVKISLTFIAGFVCLYDVCNHVVVPGLSARLSWYPMLWIRLLW